METDNNDSTINIVKKICKFCREYRYLGKILELNPSGDGLVNIFSILAKYTRVGTKNPVPTSKIQDHLGFFEKNT